MSSTQRFGGPLDGLRVALLAADGVEQVEVTAPRDELVGAGADVQVLSPTGSQLRGSHYIEPLETIPVDGAIKDTADDAFDALVLPGGLGGPDRLRTDGDALALVRSCAAAGRPIGVICHGPWLLIETGLLRERTLTCVPALRTDVVNAGARYVDEEVHVDRQQQPLLVSGRNFEAAQPFAQTLVEELAR